MKVSDVATVKTNYLKADFWLIRRHSRDVVGLPVNTFNPEHIGIKVVRTDLVDPAFFIHTFNHLHGQGVFALLAKGKTDLAQITTSDVKELCITFR